MTLRSVAMVIGILFLVAGFIGAVAHPHKLVFASGSANGRSWTAAA